MNEMKRILLDGEETPFMITKNGMLYREDTNNWYKPFESCGYLSYHLKWKNKKVISQMRNNLTNIV